MGNDLLIKMKKDIYSVGFFDFLIKVNVDDIFDIRDGKLFDDLWIESFNRLKEISIPNDVQCNIDELRELSFKLSFEIIGVPDISSIISDDIELIAKDIILGTKNSWPVNYLWELYREGVFPV
ncbi:hypothetical protein ID855_20275 [Xenorhabdus sp. ZM]|uniref:hypothetical protein n=1 Tax=Xenorhabdus szentirmaii TaxID=290112 RepID=UPI0019C6106E|nr:hypothetical protein [Xenorhabdus sp. ZM]MBD2806960.1 hypothetical protein [Xenorhabdus sp. ZM]